MDRLKVASKLMKLAKQLLAGRIELEKQFVQGGFTYYLAKKDDVVLGYLRKGKDTSTETFPWQAFLPKFVSGRPPQVGKPIGSFYEEDGGKKGAINALFRANR